MKSLRLIRWSGCVLSPPPRPCYIQYQCQYRRLLPPLVRARSAATAPIIRADDTPTQADDGLDVKEADSLGKSNDISDSLRIHSPAAQSPPQSRASKSPRLAALHARLNLPPRLPLETFARCLVDASANPKPHMNNSSLSILGNDLLGYFTSEAILCRYPRLPTEVVFAAMAAYVGPKTLATITKEWGVEHAAFPGPEVDSGLLQFARKEAGNASVKGTGTQVKELESLSEPLSATRPNPEQMLRGWRRGVSSRTMYDDYFGETIANTAPKADGSAKKPATNPITLEAASASFVRGLAGALYLHTGLRQTKLFYNAHILSRHLDISSLFSFQQPTRDLSKLCAREGFEPPVARILSETGRKSRHPVFVVGIFSGREKLGESSGGSLDEARIRAAIAALKGWYLYSPLKVRVPSETVGKAPGAWEPVMVDGGEVIV